MDKINKVLLFVGANYYPGPGVNDLIGFYDSEDAAQKAMDAYCKKYHYEDAWWQIVDHTTMQILSQGQSKYYSY